MDSRKLERILLLIAALLNVFLLIAVLSDSVQERRSNTETVASLTALLNENGIEAADGAIRIRSAPPRCTLTRDMAAEQRIMTRLIDTKQTLDQGGNIYFYSGTKGQALLRGSGEIDALFTIGAVSERGGAGSTAKRILRRYGVKALLADDTAQNGEVVDFYAAVDGIPVYNAVLRFTFAEGSLSMLAGTRCFDVVEKETDDGLLDSVSVLIRFVEIVRNEGYICSRIDAVTPGYVQTVTRSGEAELTPIWQIETDAGALLIDAETGKADVRLS